MASLPPSLPHPPCNPFLNLSKPKGLLNAGFLLHEAGRRALSAWPSSRARAARAAASGAALAAAAAAPVFLFQRAAARAFCGGGGGEGGGPYAAAPRPWCAARLPNAYGFVQKEYWGVGFLSYYELKQLPNFLLAAPALLLSAWGVRSYAKAQGAHLAAGGLLDGAALGALQSWWRGRRRSGPAAAAAPGAVAAAARGGGGGESGGRAAAKGARSRSRSRSRARGDPAEDGAATAEGSRLRRRRRRASRECAAASDGEEDAAAAAAVAASAGGECWDESAAAAAAAAPEPPGPRRAAAAVFVIHWAVLALAALLAMHVQVATRFLSAAAPPLYWFAAELALGRGGGDGSGKGGGGSGRRSRRAAAGNGTGGGAPAGWAPVLLWGYCLGFMAAGAVLFPNFYPWT